MIFRGTQQRCDALISAIDATLGRPRFATEADFLSGLLTRFGGGVQIPAASILIGSVSAPGFVDIDASGDPVTPRRRARFPDHVLTPALRALIAEARVLRLINDGTAADLEAVNGINARKRASIVAGRPWASVDALPANLLGSMNSFRSAQRSIDEDLVTTADIPMVAPLAAKRSKR